VLNPLGGGRSGKIIHNNIFARIIGLGNLFSAWKEFKKGKKNKPEVQEFEFNLEDNIFALSEELKNKTYQHSNYTSFYVRDPKLRHIHKAAVRDRVLHHAVFRILYPIFDQGFIYDSYSCRLGKGTHRAVARLEKFARILSDNYRRNIFALKCDIRKFFDSVDQNILFALIQKKIKDDGALWLINKIIKSFSKEQNKGLPLGNVTSQLFANIYLNEFDQFIKHKLKVKHYFRYTDDFIILHQNESYLKELLPIIALFLKNELKLELRPSKVFIRKLSRGIDFLGYVVLPYHKVLRTKTKRRIFKKVSDKNLQSYLGVLKHCNGYKIKQSIMLK